jgi:hypothetical protein
MVFSIMKMLCKILELHSFEKFCVDELKWRSLNEKQRQGSGGEEDSKKFLKPPPYTPKKAHEKEQKEKSKVMLVLVVYATQCRKCRSK